MALINWAKCLLTILNSALRDTLAMLTIRNPRSREPIFFLSLAKVEEAIHARDPKRSSSYSTGMFLRGTLLKISTARTALATAAQFALHTNKDSPFNSFALKRKRSFVLSKLEYELVFREQLQHLLHEKGAVNNRDDLDYKVWNSSDPLHAVLWLVSYHYLDQIILFIFNNTLFIMQAGWTEFALYA